MSIDATNTDQTRHRFQIPTNIVVPKKSRQVATYLEETDARLVSDLIPTSAITASFPATGDRMDSIEWMNEPEPDAFGAYTLVDMEKEEGTLFTRLFFVSTVDILAYKQGFASRINLQVPDELVSVEVNWEEQTGAGSSDSDWNGSATGTDISLTGSEDGSGRSSVAVMPELSVVTRQFWTNNIKSTMYFLIVESIGGMVTEASIITSLNTLFSLTVLPWPVFKPKTYTVALMGGKVSVEAGARANERVAIGTSETSYSIVRGISSGHDHSVTSSVRVIPNVICSGIGLSETRSVQVSASAAVGWPGGRNWYGVSVSKTEIGRTQGSVNGNLSATTPPFVPTSGLYLVNLAVKPFTNFSGFVMVNAEVVDASQLA